MKKPLGVVILAGIFFLFLIQLAGTLIESIYILDLMNTSLDEKALGVLFFFTPVALFFYRGKRPALVAWILLGVLVLARGLTPYLNTNGRLITSGIGTGAALCAIPFLLSSRVKGDSPSRFLTFLSSGLALAVSFSVFLRTANYGLDYSLYPQGGWVGWCLGAGLVFLLTLLEWKDRGTSRALARSAVLPVVGLFLVIALAWFAFSAPAVISRWTEGSYRWIVIAVSALSLAWVAASWFKKDWISSISHTWLLVWNLFFAASLVSTILVHRIDFPPTPQSPAVVVGSPTFAQLLPLAAMLILFPVIYVDLRVFAGRILNADPEPRQLVGGTLLGSFVLVILVFGQIFTNVWGYVEPVSPWFRNKFWLPYLLMAGLAAVLAGWKGGEPVDDLPEIPIDPVWGWGAFLGILCLGTALSAFLTTRVQDFPAREGSLVVMTYNIQQANDDTGERSVEEQLALIREIQPDILALQESDASRVSLNNNDYVRYYAGKLGYYAYFGPKTVTGTYGTAILSRYPLSSTRSVFTYSNQDEIGTTEAEIYIGRDLFTIYNVHPDGSDAAMLVFARSVLERAQGKSKLIILGDFNLRDYEEAYQLIDNSYTNAWVSVYPAKISPDGTDMSGDNRIDHIFLSPDLAAEDPVYILPPGSATDHPLHWAEIIWE